MDDQVNQLVSGFRLPYETYKGMLSAEEFAPFEAVYRELMGLADKSADMAAFTDAAMKADIFTRLSGEITKAQVLLDAKPKAERKPPTAQDWLAQYRVLYEQTLARPHTDRSRKAYEKLLALGPGAETVLEIIEKAERENLFHAIGAAGVHDTYRLEYDRTDPNETDLRKFRAEVMAVAERARTADELTYEVDRRVYESNRQLSRDGFISHLVAGLVGSFLELEISKSWVRIGKLEYLAAVAICRDEARAAYRILVDEFGLDWDTIAATPRYQKRLVMRSSVLPETSRAFQAMAVENLAWMREMLFSEILPDLPLAEIVLRKPIHVFHPLALAEHDTRHGISTRMATRAREQFRNRPWMA